MEVQPNLAKLTPEELNKRIFSACEEPECGPSKPGYVLESFADGKKARFRDCRCMLLFKQQLKYLKSDVPELFWDFSYKDLTKRFKQANAANLGLFKMWVEDLDAVFKVGAGASLMLWSSDHGAAKSALASVAVRNAIDAGKRVFWISGMDLFDDVFMGYQ